MTEVEIKELGKWLESIIIRPQERLDAVFPVKITGIEILRMRDFGLMPDSYYKSLGWVKEKVQEQSQ